MAERRGEAWLYVSQWFTQLNKLATAFTETKRDVPLHITPVIRVWRNINQIILLLLQNYKWEERRSKSHVGDRNESDA